MKKPLAWCLIHSECHATVGVFLYSLAFCLLHGITRRPLKRTHFSIVGKEKRLLLKTQNYVAYSVSWSFRVGKGPRLRIRGRQVFDNQGGAKSVVAYFCCTVYSVASNDLYEGLCRHTKYSVRLCTQKVYKITSAFWL